MLKILKGASADKMLDGYAVEIDKLLSSGESVLAIIPDQFSFEFDRKLYDKLGAKSFNKASVLSFKRLCEDLISRYGTQSGTLINNGERIVITYLALKEIKKNKSLKNLSRLLDKPSFVSEIIRLCDSLLKFGATPESLRESMENLSGTLCDKVYDIAEIFDAYLNILKQRDLRDESTVISIGSSIASQNKVFENYHVFIDRFDSFSNDEYQMISSIISSAKSVTLCLDQQNDVFGFTNTIWDVCRITEKNVCDIANSLGKSVSKVKITEKNEKPADLKAFESLLLGNRKIGEVNCENLSLVSAPSIYDEAEYIAATIRKYILQGYKYNDICCVTRDISSYAPALESAFERYDIPYYIDTKTPASTLSVSTYCMAIIEAASTRKPNTEKILKLIKSPFSNISEEEVSILEDYCVRWNVEGEMWLSDFTAEEKHTRLDKVNDIRAKVIEPLWELHTTCQNASGKEVCSAYNLYIDKCKLSSISRVIVDSYEPEERLFAARLFKQLWNKLMGAVADTYNTVCDDKLTLKSFGEILRLILSESGIANPPQKLDTLLVFDSSRSVITPHKIVFAMGVNDGKFPMDIKKTGIFSGRDTRALEEVGLTFEAGELSRQKEEQLNCFRAFNSAEEKLIISYADSDTKGDRLRPSKYVKLASKLVKQTLKVDKLSPDYYALTPKAAFYRYAITSGNESVERKSILTALSDVPAYDKKIKRLFTATKQITHTLDKDVARRLFAYDNVNITASRIDTYNKCNYQYFLKYGLDLHEIQPMSLDSSNRGTIMHHVFECVLKHFGNDFDKATDQEISDFVADILEAYIKTDMGGDFGKNATFKAGYRRYKQACCEILFNIREEYKVSKFRPVRFEYDLSKDDKQSVLSLPINEGLKLNIRGIVDRVDIYENDDGKKYIRILDYKTGPKDLKYEDIYNGLNLQMLLYIVALTEGSDVSFKDTVPAGIVYMHSGFLSCDDEYSPLSTNAEDRLKRIAKQLERPGLLVENEESVEAMDKEFSGNFAPVKRKRDGKFYENSKLISAQSFKRLTDFAKEKSVEFANNLIDGKIEAIPCGYSPKELSCRYCDFYAICDRKESQMKLITKEDGELLAEIINERGGEDID